MRGHDAWRSGMGFRRGPTKGGETAWRFQTGARIQSSPAIAADGTVYVGSGDFFIYAITPDGELRWRFKTGSFVD
eukprot:6423200-Prymnesium_polylepis.1